MTRLYNRSNLKEWRQRLRRDQTDAEAHLWYHLRNRRLDGLKFFRQYSVGSYSLDFYCRKRRIAVELDGPYHDRPEQRVHDRKRTAYLTDLQIQVVRFRNEDVMRDVGEVLRRIAEAASGNSPQPPL